MRKLAIVGLLAALSCGGAHVRTDGPVLLHSGVALTDCATNPYLGPPPWTELDAPMCQSGLAKWEVCLEGSAPCGDHEICWTEAHIVCE